MSRRVATAAQRKPNMPSSPREHPIAVWLSRTAEAARMYDARLTSLTVVLPCHDEEDNVDQAVREA